MIEELEIKGNSTVTIREMGSRVTTFQTEYSHASQPTPLPATQAPDPETTYKSMTLSTVRPTGMTFGYAFTGQM